LSPSSTALAGIGASWMSLSDGYPSTTTRTSGWLLLCTTLNGMPYSGLLDRVSWPKSGWNRPSPPERLMMLLMTADEFDATGAEAMSWFQGLSEGKSCCPRSVRSSRDSIGSSAGGAPRREAGRQERTRRDGRRLALDMVTPLGDDEASASARQIDPVRTWVGP